jgi:hypothetical protein
VGIKTISGTPAVPAPITAGKIPYANGTNALTYLPIGSVGQVLAVGLSGNAPEWRYGGKVLLASYSGTANVVLTNIPQYFREIKILIHTLGSALNMTVRDFVHTNGGTSSSGSGAHMFVQLSGTTISASNGSGTSTTAEHPSGATDLAPDGGSFNTIEITIPEYSGSTYAGSSITTNRVIYSLGLCPGQYIATAASKYNVSAANVGISGFTIDLNAVDSNVWVYAS